MAASVYWTLYELQLFAVQSVKSYIGRRRVSTRNKKHVSLFVRDFHWSKSDTSFFPGEGPTLNLLSWFFCSNSHTAKIHQVQTPKSLSHKFRGGLHIQFCRICNKLMPKSISGLYFADRFYITCMEKILLSICDSNFKFVIGV